MRKINSYLTPPFRTKGQLNGMMNVYVQTVLRNAPEASNSSNEFNQKYTHRSRVIDCEGRCPNLDE